jgi:16S rRNA processing protein RimM
MSARPVGGRETRICVAQIGAAHGLRGGVRVRSFTEDPQAFASYGPLETEDRSMRLEIDSLRPDKDGFVVRFQGVTNRTAAEALRGVNLYVDRDRLPELSENEVYHADLIGLPAYTEAGELYGHVIALHNFGAGDIIEFELEGGDTVMLAFNQATIPQIDLEAGRITVALPEETLVSPPTPQKAPAAKAPPKAAGES